jgi:hypothetical protein
MIGVSGIMAVVRWFQKLEGICISHDDYCAERKAYKDSLDYNSAKTAAMVGALTLAGSLAIGGTLWFAGDRWVQRLRRSRVTLSPVVAPSSKGGNVYGVTAAVRF